MSTTESERIGVVGLGGRGHAHAEVLHEFGLDIVAGADISTDARESFAAEYDATTYENHESMYDTESIDGVVITTPNVFHAPAAIAALERDIDALLEKPLAESLDSAQEILEAERDSDAVGMVGFTARFHTGVTLFKALDAEGRFGDLRHVETSWCRTRGIPGLGTWFTQEELAGGGAVIDIGVHIIDRALYLLDFPEVEEVSAVTRSDFGTRGEEYVNFWNDEPVPDGTFDVEDSASVFIRCADDKSISVEVAWASNRVSPDDETLVWGTEAGAAVSNESLRTISVEDTGVDHVAETDHMGKDELTSTRAVDDVFAESIRNSPVPEMPTIEQGVRVQQVLDGIYRSSEANRAVRVEGPP